MRGNGAESFPAETVALHLATCWQMTGTGDRCLTQASLSSQGRDAGPVNTSDRCVQLRHIDIWLWLQPAYVSVFFLLSRGWSKVFIHYDAMGAPCSCNVLLCGFGVTTSTAGLCRLPVTEREQMSLLCSSQFALIRSNQGIGTAAGICGEIKLPLARALSEPGA